LSTYFDFPQLNITVPSMTAHLYFTKSKFKLLQNSCKPCNTSLKIIEEGDKIKCQKCQRKV